MVCQPISAMTAACVGDWCRSLRERNFSARSVTSYFLAFFVLPREMVRASRTRTSFSLAKAKR